ncbi:MAG: hypothetical protein QOF58_2521 [Pseudonocardiales bacterium]|jgi:hypothetical protein|nr:hypothetical protein [Pseudonocardiales bacterium]
MAIRGWKAAATSLVVMGLSLGQLPANAAPAYADDHFTVCVPGYDCRLVYIRGEIKWGNRTAMMYVTFRNSIGGSLSGHFTGYAGSNKIDSHVSYSSDNFSIGDPNLVGGINRIKTQACISGTEGQFVCTDPPQNDSRD